MKRELDELSRRYQAALRLHLKHAPRPQGTRLPAARTMGRRALALGLETLALARLHESTLIALMSDYPLLSRAEIIKRASLFFAEAITPLEKINRTARETNVKLIEMVERLSRRRAELAASNRQLKQQIAQRRSAEKALRTSQKHYSQSLAQSRRLEEQLRLLSHELLSAQEEERKKISRDLHDDVVQTLTGINLQLAELKMEAVTNVKGIAKRITRTQRLVEKSVEVVHRFARELRPPVLDDLGLIPALQSYLKSFTERTGIIVRTTAFAGVEKLDNIKRTVLYRVAQEALTNVGQHSQATRVSVKITMLSEDVCMEISDNGKSFPVQKILRSKRNRRLGLLGMRERVEMIGGRFTIESAPGKGTTIRAQIPLNKPKRVAKK
jgi:signal transduction histidine kinase